MSSADARDARDRAELLDERSTTARRAGRRRVPPRFERLGVGVGRRGAAPVAFGLDEQLGRHHRVEGREAQRVEELPAALYSSLSMSASSTSDVAAQAPRLVPLR